MKPNAYRIDALFALMDLKSAQTRVEMVTVVGDLQDPLRAAYLADLTAAYERVADVHSQWTVRFQDAASEVSA